MSCDKRSDMLMIDDDDDVYFKQELGLLMAGGY